MQKSASQVLRLLKFYVNIIKYCQIEDKYYNKKAYWFQLALSLNNRIYNLAQQQIKIPQRILNKMSNQILPDQNGLLLQSRVRTNKQIIVGTPVNSVKQIQTLLNSPIKSLNIFEKDNEQRKVDGQRQHTQNIYNCNMKQNSILKESTKLGNSKKDELSRLLQQADISRRNLAHEVEFYVRGRMKDLVTIQEFLVAKQYQRMYVYVQTELSQLRKLHQSYLTHEETCCKPMLTKDISVKSNVQQDLTYKTLIGNLLANLKQFDINNIFVIPIIKKLSNQVNLSTKKLSWYFQQVPFQAPSHHVSTNLAIKFIGELGCSNGNKVIQQINKSLQLKMNRKYNASTNDQLAPKSEMSKLIEQHSNSRIKANK